MNLVFASGVLFPQRVLGVDYFDGLPELYPAPAAIFPKVALVGNIADRAQDLANKISAHEFPDGPIHIIAHSMGGLDARCLLAQNVNGLTPRIASLSTIATPHRGSPIADLVKAGLADGLLKEAIDSLLGEKRDALDDLTTEAAKTFNADNADVPGKKYFSYAGNNHTSIFLRLTHDYIANNANTPDEKINDGVVSLASAKWPTELVEGPWDADHFALVGHKLGVLSPFDHIDAYRRVVKNAASQPLG
jgi:triacylglycerol lipase